VYIVPSSSTWGAGNYSFFEEYPYCHVPPLNQGACLSCWAIAVAATLSHRFCRAMRRQFALNPDDLLSSGPHFIGCNAGGHESLAWRHLEFIGLPSLDCNRSNSSCEMHFSEYRSAKTFVGEDEMRDEIRRNGPVTAFFAMPDSFFDYGSGVYDAAAADVSQLHTVEIVGWGVDVTPYWLVQNSFGAEWGIGGLAKIVRGSNHLGIERYATTGRPRLPPPRRE
jgi:cathepsin B